MKDVYNDSKAELALKVQLINSDTTTVGETIDTQGFLGALFEAFTGVLTDGDYQFKLYEGDESDMSDESEVAAGDVLGDIPNWAEDTDDDKIEQFAYIGHKRYTRIKVVSTNNGGSGATLGAVVTKMLPRHAPVGTQAP
jgi:hypothetical protein